MQRIYRLSLNNSNCNYTLKTAARTTMRLITYIYIFVVCLMIIGNTVWATDAENTYVFAASACPPWKSRQLEKHAKHIASACKNDVDLFTSKVKEAFNVQSENIMKVVDEQATYDGLRDSIKEFADKVPDVSRVIMYFNFHGILSDIDQQDKPATEEVLILWTEDKPFTVLSAIETKQWITADELRQMIDRVKADEIVIAVDACHSGGAVHDILKEHGRDADWNGNEAVMVSSKSDQYSYLQIDGSFGLFTYNLSEAMVSGSSNFQEAFEKASANVIGYLAIHSNQIKCRDIIWNTLHKRVTCIQNPVVKDPSGLLQSIKLKNN